MLLVIYINKLGFANKKFKFLSFERAKHRNGQFVYLHATVDLSVPIVEDN
jgi:hypothetical protein